MVLTALLVVAGVGLACLAYGGLIEREWYVLRRHRVACLPPGARPLRVLHISDLHFRQGQARKARFLSRFAETRPDIVVCTGDFLDNTNGLDTVVEAVGNIQPAVAAFFVLGSHDYYESRLTNPFKYLRRPKVRKEFRGKPMPWEALVERLEAGGWTLLLNRATRIDVDGVGSVDVVGLDDPHMNRDDLSVASARSGPGFRLGVVHSPDAAPALADLGYDLIVCGHTHGGQLRVPGLGALVTNTRRLPRSMARGVHRMGDAWLHVSAGLGTSAYAPIRFACRPEACILELVPRDASADQARAASTLSNART